jgi:hypothetical protein
MVSYNLDYLVSTIVPITRIPHLDPWLIHPLQDETADCKRRDQDRQHIPERALGVIFG